jgi:hypothetical protein
MSILRLTNFEDHPHDHRYMVFNFPTSAIAGEFMDELTMAAIPFEADDSGGPPFLIAVKKQFRERAVRANYIVTGRHRERFIGDDVFRWFLLAFVGFAILLAILGVLNRPE